MSRFEITIKKDDEFILGFTGDSYSFECVGGDNFVARIPHDATTKREREFAEKIEALRLALDEALLIAGRQNGHLPSVYGGRMSSEYYIPRLIELQKLAKELT